MMRSRFGGAFAALLLLASHVEGEAQGVTIREFPVPTPASGAQGMTTGPDGNVWFVETGANKIGRITTSGIVTEFPLAAPTAPFGITAGPDGNVWFTESNGTGNRINSITPAGVIGAGFVIPTVSSSPQGIATGPDANLWFTEFAGNKIGRITPAGAITEFPVPTPSSSPLGITAGPDGNLWFTEFAGNKIGRITPSGTITEFPIPTPSSVPQGITVGPDGNLWFVERTGNKVGRITPSGDITEFPLPSANSRPAYIAAGPDGALWFTQVNGGRIGRITTGGVITEFPLPTLGSRPFGITRGADGGLWLSEAEANKIAVVRPSCSDSFSAAMEITGASGAIWSDTTGATGESGEPDHGGNSGTRNSIWCKWTAPASGPVTFDTAGSRFDTVLGVYTGAAVNALTFVAGNDNGASSAARVTFPAIAGTTYMIAIDGPGTAVGEVTLAWRQDPATTPLVAAVLPTARSGIVGQTVTAFAAMINTGGATLANCAPSLPPGFPASFTYQTTSPSNTLTGAPNTPATIAAGATQNFVFGINPSVVLGAADVGMRFSCTGATARSTLGLNTFILSASVTATPDLVAIASTPSSDGIVSIPGSAGTTFFAASAVNIGAAGQITATVDDGGANLSASVALCESDPVTAACVNPPSPGPSATFNSATNQVTTLTIRVTGTGNVPFDPATNRLFLRFKTADGVTRGATSVAVRTAP